MENKKTYEELKEELDKLFNAGKIDQIFYEKEMAKLDYKIKEKAKREKANKVQGLKNKSSVVLVIVILIIASIVVISNLKTVGKNYEEVESFDRLSSPIQERSGGGATIENDDGEFHVEFLYSYTLYGRVADTYTYRKNSTDNKVSPKDIAVMWGPLAQDRFFDDIDVRSLGSRRAQFIFKNPEIYNNMGNIYFSNNHLVPSSPEIEKLIDKIDRNHYIKIEGYLCNITGNLGSMSYFDSIIEGTDSNEKYEGGEYLRESSTNREDGSCETIYVTDVKWLKEK